MSAPKPFRARAFHGESFTLACTPTQYAKPLTGLSGATVALRWQTDGMDPDEWYEAPGAYDPATGELSAAWSPDCDTGADRVRFFLALTTPGGASFRAFGTLDLAPSPGFTPAQPVPESALDALRKADAAEATARQEADEALEKALQDHATRTDNPHAVTAGQVGAATPKSVDDALARAVATVSKTEGGTVALRFQSGEAAPFELRLYVDEAHGELQLSDSDGKRATLPFADAVAEAIADALTKTGCNQIAAPVKLIRKDGSGNPVLLIGSQLNGEGMKEDRWTLALHYDRLVFKTTPGGETHTLLFNRPGDDKANSDAIVLWKELVAALADATEGLVGAEGGTVGGVLRMKNPKVAADDDTAHDIALVPNAAGAGLQFQFPGGDTAMVRAKSGTLATVAEVNAAVAAEAQAREEAIETIALTPGPQGPQGEKGDTGPTGPQGPQGEKGDKGDPGQDGQDGEDGAPGAAATVSVGFVVTLDPGENASVVNIGTPNAAMLNFAIPRGAKGDTGPQGPQGVQGPQGEKGETGATGPQGPAGKDGADGQDGAPGATGPQGPQGEVGPQGPKGDTGDTGPQGEQGPQGPQGARGLSGTAATVTIGSVTTLPAGSNATVTNSGTSTAAVLNFGIPRGADGSGGGSGGSGDGVPWAAEAFTDSGYLLLGTASFSAFVAAFGQGGEGVDLNIGEPYLGLVKGPTAGGSGKPAAITLGVGGLAGDPYHLMLAIGGKRLFIPFNALCNWAVANLSAAVEEI